MFGPRKHMGYAIHFKSAKSGLFLFIPRFSPAILLYLISIVPSLWLLELHPEIQVFLFITWWIEVDLGSAGDTIKQSESGWLKGKEQILDTIKK